MAEHAPVSARPLAVAAAGLAVIASVTFALGAPEHVDEDWIGRGFFLVVAVTEIALAAALVSWAARPAFPSWTGSVLVYGAVLVAAAVLIYVVTLATGGTHLGHDPSAGPRPVDVVTRLAEVGVVVALLRLQALLSG